MFRRLDKFDRPIFGWGGGIYTGGSYIRDVNWVTYLGGVLGGLIYGGRINGILWYMTLQANLLNNEIIVFNVIVYFK